MTELDKKITQLIDQTWQVARDSLDAGETIVYRSLTDIAEKLKKLIGSSDKLPVVVSPNAKLLPIFARYRGKRYEAELDVFRIEGGRGHCVFRDGKWQTASGSVGTITNTSVNGWRNFWKFTNNGKEASIENLRKIPPELLTELLIKNGLMTG